MQKINFQNLPSTTTPINATNLNAIQTNVENVFNGSETMGNIVVGSIRTKNMFNSDSPSAMQSGMTWIGNGKSHYLTSNITFGGGIRWYFEAKAGEQYTFSYKQRNSTNVYLYIRELATPDWGGTTLKNIVNDGTGTSYSFTIQNDCYLGIAFQNGEVISNVLIEELQLERGLIKTNYSLYDDYGLKGMIVYSQYLTNGASGTYTFDDPGAIYLVIGHTNGGNGGLMDIVFARGAYRTNIKSSNYITTTYTNQSVSFTTQYTNRIVILKLV